jgi:hypothetical protein
VYQLVHTLSNNSYVMRCLQISCRLYNGGSCQASSIWTSFVYMRFAQPFVWGHCAVCVHASVCVCVRACVCMCVCVFVSVCLSVCPHFNFWNIWLDLHEIWVTGRYTILGCDCGRILLGCDCGRYTLLGCDCGLSTLTRAWLWTLYLSREWLWMLYLTRVWLWTLYLTRVWLRTLYTY